METCIYIEQACCILIMYTPADLFILYTVQTGTNLIITIAKTKTYKFTCMLLFCDLLITFFVKMGHNKPFILLIYVTLIKNNDYMGPAVFYYDYFTRGYL